MKLAKVYEDDMYLGYLTEEPDTEPTYDRNKAKKFKSKAEAEKYLALYDGDVFCFGKVVMVEANISDAPLSDQIEDFIRCWVGKHYGESEMREPSWNIELLAKQLAKKLQTK